MRIGHARVLRALAAAALVAAIAPPCARSGEETMPELQLVSPAFTHGQPIPARYTADGEDVSPPLAISGAPSGTASFALICDDPDAPVGTWVHWVVWNLPAGTDRLEEGKLPAGSATGRNSWGRGGWGGPSPPSGTHRYFFKLFALDTTLELSPATDAKGLERAISGHVLARAELMGTYSRRR
jgi:Raf kinase inhibitor-like YbhB/YbcL family protein